MIDLIAEERILEDLLQVLHYLGEDYGVVLFPREVKITEGTLPRDIKGLSKIILVGCSNVKGTVRVHGEKYWYSRGIECRDYCAYDLNYLGTVLSAYEIHALAH